MFYTQWNRPPKNPELPDSLSEVETAGYISTEKRIKQFEQAGQRLVDFRSGKFFDFDEEEQEEAYSARVDPTRAPGLDLAEAVELYNEAAERLQEATRRSREARQANLAIKPVEEGENLSTAQEAALEEGKK